MPSFTTIGLPDLCDMKQYSYEELLAYCEHDQQLPDLLNLVVDAALAEVLSAVRGQDCCDNLQKLTAAVEQINNHLFATKGHGCFFDPGLLQNQVALRRWAIELTYMIFQQRRL